MGILDAAKRKLGQVIGKVGNVAQQVTSKVIPGKQIVPGGLSAQAQILGRKLNPVKTASAAEAPMSRPSAPSSNYTPAPSRPSSPVSAPRPSGGAPAPQPQAQPSYQPSYEVPSVGESVGSEEDYANQQAEQRMRRYGEVVAPVQADIESYLSGRPDIKNLFEQEMAAQGIPNKQKSLETFEGEERKLAGQLETIPGEEIARRKETGMLTAAAERRIRQMEERPIREQLLKTSSAKEVERVGLQRAFDLVDKMLELVREQEKRGMEPLTARLEGAKGEFGQEVEALAAKLSGFTNDRKAQLEEYKAKVDAGLKLTLAEKKEASELNQMAIDHQNKLEQIAAKDEDETAFDKKQEISQTLISEVEEGATLDDLISRYVAGGMKPEDILTVYNSRSPNGPAQQSSTKYRLSERMDES
mgnify:CR=1 FL=1